MPASAALAPDDRSRRALRRPGRLSTLSVILVLVAAVLAACGGGGTAKAGTQGQTVTVGVPTLQEQQPDPMIANVGSNLYPVKWSVGELLVNRDEKGALVPGLATSWESSADGLTWTISLRSGVKMQDGSAFTAADVKTSMDRAVEKKADPLFAGYAQWSSSVKDVSVVDDSTVELRLTQPNSNAVSDAPAPIATDYYTKVGDEAFQKEPVAAGPWKFTSQKQNDSMTFTRFDDFWDATRKPAAKTLVLKIIPDESQRVSALQTGQIDIAGNLSPASTSQLKGSAELKEVPDASQANVYFPDQFTGKKGPASDPRVRKALLMAIDRAGIVKSLYGGLGSVPTSSYLPTTLGYDESAQPVAYDPDGAKALLKEAGADGMSFTLSTYAATTSVADVQKLAETVVSYWKQIGVDAKLNVVDPAAYLENVRAHKYSDAIILCSPGSLLADPNQFGIFFSSTGAYSALKDDRIDEYFTQLNAATTIDAKKGVAEKLRADLDTNLFSIPLVNTSAVHGTGARIAEWTPMAGNPVPGPFWTLKTK